MKLSRQVRRATCRKLAAAALKAMPVQESRREMHDSRKLLARRMYAEAPQHVPDGSILLGPNDGNQLFVPDTRLVLP